MPGTVEFLMNEQRKLSDIRARIEKPSSGAISALFGDPGAEGLWYSEHLRGVLLNELDRLIINTGNEINRLSEEALNAA